MKISLALATLGLLAAAQLIHAENARPKPPAASSLLKKTIPIALAQNGKALLPIVISSHASADTKAVADELAGYLKRISGADFEVEVGDGNTGIVLGTLEEFPNSSLEAPLAIHGFHDGAEAFAIRSEAKRLLLLGATDLGASHAAFRFLETLGCRWYFPAKEWEVIPSKSTLRVALDETSRPAVLARLIWWGHGLFQDAENPDKPKEEWRTWREWNGWKRHNRMAFSYTVNASHAYSGIYEKYKSEFDAHPEYLALVGGKRFSGQLCISNPGARQLAVNYALDYLRKNPKEEMVSMEPADGALMCECEECAKMGSISERVFTLANVVARAVAKEFPGKRVGLLAYYEHSDPPSFMLEPNIDVQLATLYTDGKYSFRQQLDMWPQHTKNLGIYDYLSTWVWDQDRLRPALSTGPAGSLKYVRTQIPLFAARGMKSYYAESSCCWGHYGVGYYLTNKLLWDPHADVDALLKDFYEKAFGPAAPAMQRFYNRISPDSKPIFGPDLLARAYRDVQDATTLAAGRPDVQARIDDIKQYLRFNYLHWIRDAAAPGSAERKRLYLELLTQTYRTRYSYMVHATPVITAWTGDAAKEFNEPNWNYWVDSKDKPWKVETPYTHEETEREFQEGLQYFQPREVEEKKFSNDLVPVEMPASKITHYDAYMTGRISTQFFEAPARIAIYSFNGDPIEFELMMVAKPPGEYFLSDANGKILLTNPVKPVSERMLNDNHVQKFRFPVPEAGIYYLEVRSRRWAIGFDEKQQATVELPRERDLDSYAWGGQISFYVPKGTKQIQYYWSGLPHQIFNPENEVVQDVKINNDYVSIPVPEGMDGKVWGLRQRLGQMWLFNCPNFVAAMPDALMVPRELAEKDGLTIRH